MRFLIDEMFAPAVARSLSDLGHDAQHVRDVGLAGRSDDEVFDHATIEDHVIVTENAVDFVSLLDRAASMGNEAPPVMLALKRTLPTAAGAMEHQLVSRLARWADVHPDPYRHIHWLP